ncbi:hypothetical protein GOQ27_10745 [Clostridium sp. D2Q-11]|uniref:Uncharacterized protein n=1 Tax=Anaeromonas frigoriresistens TaxID=2683708 RepID=A0A942UXU0_9FIRM|nr:CBO0543 family protein [Anaeromonas frigoriresistens]MBS4538946.1 hypothetical protein [Anaeromonas frigoriresistens]
MVFNYVFGLGFSWILMYLIYRKDKKVVLFIFPFSSLIAHTVNAFGFYLKFWTLTPVKWHSFAALPFDLGYFSLIGVFFIYLARNHKKLSPFLILIILSLIATALEAVFLLSGKIIYYPRWNLLFTFFSYLIPYGIVYGYYTHIKIYIKD